VVNLLQQKCNVCRSPSIIDVTHYAGEGAAQALLHDGRGTLTVTARSRFRKAGLQNFTGHQISLSDIPRVLGSDTPGADDFVAHSPIIPRVRLKSKCASEQRNA
jgi:hypothetical protein